MGPESRTREGICQMEHLPEPRILRKKTKTDHFELSCPTRSLAAKDKV